MQTVYAVASGEYSDYRIHALFEVEADAEAHAAKRNEGGSAYESASVEEFSFYPAGEQPERLTVFHISAYRSMENPYKETQRSDVVWSYDYEGDFVSGSAVPSGTSVLTSGGDPVSTSSWGKSYNARARGTDPERTRKAFQDAMYRAKAEYEGLD